MHNEHSWNLIFFAKANDIQTRISFDPTVHFISFFSFFVVSSLQLIFIWNKHNVESRFLPAFTFFVLHYPTYDMKTYSLKNVKPNNEFER